MAISSVQGKVALVTGANRGIGAATVKELLKAGAAKVYATARDPKSLPSFNEARVIPLSLDITSDASVAAAANFGVAVFTMVSDDAAATAHIPHERRGMLGNLSAQQSAALRAQLIKRLSR